MKVLIVRLYAKQFRYLEDAYDGPHELDFIDEETVQQIRERCNWADKVLAITKFMDHKQWDAIPREKVIHVDSVSTDKLIYALEQIPDEKPVRKVAVHPALKKEPTAILAHAEPTGMSTSTTRKIGKFILTKAVPPPTHASDTKSEYPFEFMEVGESFFVETKDQKEAAKLASRISASASYYRKRYAENSSWKVSGATKEGPGVRVWRMPDGERDRRGNRTKGAARKTSKHKDNEAHVN